MGDSIRFLVFNKKESSMKENSRVFLGIVLWTVVALFFVAAGIYVIAHGMGKRDREVQTEIYASAIEHVEPESVGLDSHHLGYIAPKVEEYIAMGATEGAVVAVVREDKLAYLEAFGNRERGGEAMTIDVRFDLASLTKPVAVATSIMQLVERGEVSLEQRVSAVIPEFQDYVDPKTKEVVYATIGDLMSHSSGLRPYVALSRLEQDYPDREFSRELLLEYIMTSERIGAPRTICKYSCLNYILLGEIVERLTGVSLAEYATQNIFAPLQMTNTCFTPNEEYAQLSAPTSAVGADEELRGVVNDPLARELMAGVSGNAGLFSTAEDLAVYVAMLLNGGEWQGERVLTSRAVEMLFTAPEGVETTRTMAWDRLSSNFEALEEGEVGSIYVHTGATGTSIHIDREQRMAIIILTNRTHAEGAASDIKELRRSIATIVSYAVM